ncbi:hypothetical protein RND81_03G015000 [Saponaria officinalis]|uniref:Uncharacterized protein n=1 Tax=Saponaria officinalis TaxID=3572 RepID=A0AAW1M4J4_SAPOF
MTTDLMNYGVVVNPKEKELVHAHDRLLPMVITSENFAHRFGVTKEEQDHATVNNLIFLSCYISL